MTIKASLRIILKANDIEIAESDDPKLWQEVFAAITQNISPEKADVVDETKSIPTNNAEEVKSVKTTNLVNSDPKSLFAKELGISMDELEGALGPTFEEPYIHLDPHCWEALRKNTGPRGRNSVAPTALAATVLALWFNHARIEEPTTIKLCSGVLNTIHLTDKNAPRAIKNTEWLQNRATGIFINPAQRSRAIALAASFCTKSPIN